MELEGRVRLTSALLDGINSDVAGTVAAREAPRSWSMIVRQHNASISSLLWKSVYTELKDGRHELYV